MADLSRPGGAVVQVPALAKEMGERFRLAGHELYLVGGIVRDLLLGRVREDADLDFATDALPRETTRLLRDWAERNVRLVGVKYGTVAARRANRVVEVTTFRQ